ncbi:Cof-type HAD-IIB family hydrolase [Tumidithrix elongata RA019]|uniref:Cof-type HAD-IIB family hydrolase n=1 Tax=Tumidithrix elongata BACA0141 TaxID=2716417 RepID=A0AAW9PSS3_9CYAN|nr:Cof-type HAD-IIB family hydrolase [Tumidithrix elongata RA019]
MKQSIQLIVVDIDGTISGDANQVNEPVKQAIKAAQAKGVKVGIATGRMYRSALRFHEAIASDLPLISYQGALIKDPQTQNVVGHWPVDLTHALTLIDDFAEFATTDRLSVHLYVNDKLYVKEITPQSAAYAERSKVEAIPVGDLREFLIANSAENPPTKILALSDSADLITEMLAKLKNRYASGELYLTKSVATFFEATNPIANKGTAVKHLAENILGLDRTQVMAIGDNFNDLEMIEYAGLGVVMGNAPDDLKEKADWIAPSVEMDGVAAAIVKFVL